MQIAAARLPEQLQKGVRSLYTLHGDEPLLIQETADLIRQTAREHGFTERQVFTVIGAHFDWAQVHAAAGEQGEEDKQGGGAHGIPGSFWRQNNSAGGGPEPP